MTKALRFFVVSNMYPSADHPAYGVFVRNFEEGIQAHGQILAGHSVIQGKGGGAINKAFKYLSFILGTIIKGLFAKADVIYVHFISHTVIPVVVLSWLSGKKIVLNAHGTDVMATGGVQKRLFPLIRYMVLRSDALVVPSNFFKKVVMEKYGIAADKVIVSPSGGIDTDIFYPNKEKKATGPFTIGYVSRADKGKGWEYFMDAVGKFKQAYPDRAIKVITVGGGVQQQEMLTKAKQLGLSDVLDDKGSLPQKQMRNAMVQMDVMVFPTYLPESLGLVGIEAMACAVPVFASNIGGIPDYVDDGNNGYLVEPQNVDAIFKAIDRFYGLNAEEKRAFSEHALATAKRFTRSTVTEQLLLQLQTVLGS